MGVIEYGRERKPRVRLRGLLMPLTFMVGGLLSCATAFVPLTLRFGVAAVEFAPWTGIALATCAAIGTLAELFQKGPPDSRTPRRAVALVAVLACGFTLTHHRATWIVAVGLGVSDSEAAGARWTFAIADGWRIDGTHRIVHARRAFGDSDTWFAFQIPPGEIDAYRSDLLGSPDLRFKLRERSDVRQYPGSSTPWWWTAESLADAEAFYLRESTSSGLGIGRWYVLSKRTGLIYVYCWSI